MCCESLRLSLRFLDLCTCIHFANVRFFFSSALCSETTESIHFCLVTMRCLFFTTPIPGRLDFRPHSFAAEHSIIFAIEHSPYSTLVFAIVFAVHFTRLYLQFAIEHSPYSLRFSRSYLLSVYFIPYEAHICYRAFSIFDFAVCFDCICYRAFCIFHLV